MKVLKIFLNPRVVTAVISAVGAIVSALCAGCKLYCGKISVDDFEAEIFSQFNLNTNQVERVK